jgi:co-chaperonin GroES (HSP10)
MLKLLQGKIACVPIFDSNDSGVKGIQGHVDALGAQLGYKQSGGNIQLLDNYRERVDQGIVKYMGHGVTQERFGFGIGDLVIFSGYTGELVSIEGDRILPSHI